MIYGVSLCSGVGMLELAVKLAIGDQYRCIAYCEREAFAAATLARLMQAGILDQGFIWDDLGTFPCGKLAGRISVLSAGLPCQPYSVAGKRKGHDDERAIWPSFMGIVRDIQPELVFLENVPAIAPWFRPIGDALHGMGYRFEAGLFSADEVGASQKRLRFFCLAVSGSSSVRRNSGSPPGAKEEGDSQRGKDGPCSDGPSESDSALDDTPGPRRSQEEQGPDKRRPGERGWERLPGDRCRDVEQWTCFKCFSKYDRPTHAEGWHSDGSPAGVYYCPMCRDVGDANRTGRTGRTGERGDDVDDAARDGERRSTRPSGTGFPPGPSGLEEWAKILEASPWLAPATQPGVRGVADGLTLVVDKSRADQLRALGNGVVVATAAKAFRVLASRLGVS